MATTLDELKHFLDDAGLKYDAHDEDRVIAVGFSGESDDTTYRDEDGDPHVQVLVRLVEEGEFCAAFVPRAWRLADCQHRAAVCEAAARIQGKMKLVRFDLDDNDHLQPNIEIPLEKAPMCAEQLHRAIACLLITVREYDPVIRHAMTTGEVDLELAKEDVPEPPADITRVLELGEAVGGLDALERLLGDSDAPPIQA
jgi:hypothetical protein